MVEFSAYTMVTCKIKFYKILSDFLVAEAFFIFITFRSVYVPIERCSVIHRPN